MALVLFYIQSIDNVLLSFLEAYAGETFLELNRVLIHFLKNSL
jgi:hypothetical protein